MSARTTILPVAGARWVFRRLGPADLAAIEGHFMALGETDRYQRFHACFGDAAIAAYARWLDFTQMIVFGAIDGRTGQVLALAEAHLDDAATPFAAEISVSVRASHRRRGLARKLVRQALVAAFDAGARRADFVFTPENQAIIALVRQLGAHIDRCAGCASINWPTEQVA